MDSKQMGDNIMMAALEPRGYRLEVELERQLLRKPLNRMSRLDQLVEVHRLGEELEGVLGGSPLLPNAQAKIHEILSGISEVELRGYDIEFVAKIYEAQRWANANFFQHSPPSGTHGVDKALRYNSGKVDLCRIPHDAELEEAKVWTLSAEKYPDCEDGSYNWEKLWGDGTVKLVLGSLLRHANAIKRGEVNDPETGLQHAAHIRCNAAMLIRYFNNKKVDK